MNKSKLIYEEESYKIIGCCLEVHNVLEPGFLEAFYQVFLSYKLWRKEFKI